MMRADLLAIATNALDVFREAKRKFRSQRLGWVIGVGIVIAHALGVDMNNASHEERSRASEGRSKVAVVQAASVAFDLERTLQKAEALASDAASQGARLLVFPEAFLSAYARGLAFGAVVGSRSEAGREEYRRYWESSVEIPGAAVTRLSGMARDRGDEAFRDV